MREAPEGHGTRPPEQQDGIGRAYAPRVTAQRLEPPGARTAAWPTPDTPARTWPRRAGPVHTVLVADGSRWVADAVAAWLADEGFDVVATCTDEEEVVGAAVARCPQLALLDADLPRRGAIAAAQRSLQDTPDTKFVLLSAGRSESDQGQRRPAGFFGLISKDASPKAALRWLRMAASRDEPPAADVRRDGRAATAAQLTPREREILRLLGEGASGQLIAASLGISHHTVRTHIQNIMGKLNARSRVEAVALAAARGLLNVRRPWTDIGQDDGYGLRRTS